MKNKLETFWREIALEACRDRDVAIRDRNLLKETVKRLKKELSAQFKMNGICREVA